jgi:hypothetical protein
MTERDKNDGCDQMRVEVLNNLYMFEANGLWKTVEVSKWSVSECIMRGDLMEGKLVTEDTSVGWWKLSRGGQTEEQSSWSRCSWRRCPEQKRWSGEDIENLKIKCMVGQEKRHVLSQRTDSVELRASLVSVSNLTKSGSPDEIGNIWVCKVVRYGC